MVAPQWTERNGTLLGRLLAFGQLRDTVLFLATAAYVLGYLTWAIYSSDVGLGVLPPLEGQYFLAGIVPLLLLLGAVLALQVLAPLPLEAERRRAGRRSQLVVGPSVLIIMVAGALGEQIGLPGEVAGWLLAAAAVGMYLGLALSVRSGESGTGWVLWLLRISVPLLFVVGLMLCATRLFPLLPRELGGPRAQCVQLDVATASLSPATLEGLKIEPVTTTARTGPLWLHFDGGGVMVLSERRARPVPSVFRVRDANVHAVLPSEHCQGIG